MTDRDCEALLWSGVVCEVPLGEVVGIVPLEDDGCVTGVSVVTVPLAVVRSADVVVMLTEAVVTLMEAVVTLREAVVTTNVVLPSCEAVVTLLETVGRGFTLGGG